jgi:magnesium-transporting ATPase (P-type)
MNQMSVTAMLWGNEGKYVVPSHSDMKEMNDSSTIKELLLGACLCNNATKPSSSTNGTANPAVEMTNDNLTLTTSKVVGDAVDVALYHLCQDECSMDVEQMKKVNPRINVIPFNSKNKFMITANLLQGNNENVLITLKGAPDFVLSRCSTYKSDENDEILSITDEFKHSIQERQEMLGKSGYRVIAMLQQKISKSQYDGNMAAYKKSKTQQQQSDESDLNGFPASNYCFIGKKTKSTITSCKNDGFFKGCFLYSIHLVRKYRMLFSKHVVLKFVLLWLLVIIRRPLQPLLNKLTFFLKKSVSIMELIHLKLNETLKQDKQWLI